MDSMNKHRLYAKSRQHYPAKKYYSNATIALPTKFLSYEFPVPIVHSLGSNSFHLSEQKEIIYTNWIFQLDHKVLLIIQFFINAKNIKGVILLNMGNMAVGCQSISNPANFLSIIIFLPFRQKAFNAHMRTEHSVKTNCENTT